MAEELETRKCILTGKIKPKDELLRFTVLKNGDFLPDFNKKLGGKGVYISNSKSLISGHKKDVKIGKLLHKPVNTNPEIPELVEKILAAKGLETLNLARKSGNLVLGFDKIKEQILKDKVAFVIEAVDAGADGTKKMSELCRDLEQFRIYDSATLDRAFNRETVVYLAVLKSEISTMVYATLKKYATYLNG